MKQQMKNKFYLFFWLFSVSLVLASCAPKKQGVRASSKKASVVVNPTATATADQQATQINANYKIYSIGFPEVTGSSYVVNSEIQDPSMKYIPVVTTHEDGQLDSEGMYTDSARGLQVYVHSRCSEDECSRYYMLVTVVRNNQAIYQNGAVSFKQDDCSFYTTSISVGSKMHQSLDSFVNSMSHLTPIGNTNSCYE